MVDSCDGLLSVRWQIIPWTNDIYYSISYEDGRPGKTCGALSIHEFPLWWPTMTWETYLHNKKIFYHNNFILFEFEFQCCILNVWYSSLACWIYQWNVKIDLHSLLFPNTGIVQASRILLRRRIAPVYPTWPISWMLLTWRRKEISNHDIDLTILELAGFSTRTLNFNSSPPSAAYMRWGTWSALVLVIACPLFGAKPLPEPLLTDPKEQTSVKFKSKYQTFHS